MFLYRLCVSFTKAFPCCFELERLNIATVEVGLFSAACLFKTASQI